jgi:hypothetical protein
MSTMGFFSVGMTPARAGRSTPRMRPMVNMAAATVAPELPAEMSPSARPSLTRRQQTMIDESFFLRRASEGFSSMPTTSGAWTMSMLRFLSLSGARVLSSSARMESSSPTRMMSTPRSAAVTAAGTLMRGPKSPPMASTTMRGVLGIVLVQNLTSPVGAAGGAHAVRKARFAAFAVDHVGSFHLMVGTAHALAGMGSSFLR